MESGIQSSFIPRDAGEVKLTAPRISGAGFSDLVLLLSIVLFVASAALAGGVFLYKQYMQTATQSKIDQLQRAKAAFDPSLIQQFTRLDDRMHSGSTILTNHISPTAFFDALAQATLTTVAFTSLSFDGSDPLHLGAKISGVAQSVNSIALQAQVFSKNGVVVNPIFSNIGRQADGVHFELSLLINPKAINYAQNLNAAAHQQSLQGQQGAQTQQPPAQQAQPSPFGGTSANPPAPEQSQ